MLALRNELKEVDTYYAGPEDRSINHLLLFVVVEQRNEFPATEMATALHVLLHVLHSPRFWTRDSMQ